ncbi:hypothetical protein FB480_101831 [Agrobacterium vitis]|nr:hypothetical protein FB480_101831 [Agrobacterium vitis]
MVQPANMIWADGPVMSAQNPDKNEIRTWGTWLESLIAAGSLGDHWYASKAAATSAAGALANGTAVVVYGDATASNNGLYIVSSGALNQIADFLPGWQLVRTSDNGTSDANGWRLNATPFAPSTEGAVIFFGIVPYTNTSTNVYVSLNYGPTYPVKSIIGSEPGIGDLAAGMPFFAMMSSGQFRLMSDSAIASSLFAARDAAQAAQALAEIAQAQAEASADTATSSAALVQAVLASVFLTRVFDFYVDPASDPVSSVTIPDGYVPGQVSDVRINGIGIEPTEFDATSGTDVSLVTPITTDDLSGDSTTVHVRVEVGYKTNFSVGALDASYIRRGINSISRAGNYLGIGQQADFSNLGIGGLLIGAGYDERGSGALLSADGLSNWLALRPSKDQNPQELIIYNSASQGYAQTVSGTNRINRLVGTPFKTEWVGRYIYFLRKRFRVVSVLSGDAMTLSEIGGGSVTFPLNEIEAYNYCYTSGTGTCNIVGDRLHWVSGDPFVPLFFDDFNFTLAGAGVTISSFVSAKEMILSAAPGNATNVAFTWRGIIFDQLSTLRVQAILGENEENVNLYTVAGQEFLGRYHALRAGTAGVYGKSRPIYMGSGFYGPSRPRDQVGLYPEDGVHGGYVSLGGVQGYEALRVFNPTTDSGATAKNWLEVPHVASGFKPVIRAAGVDSSIGFNLSTKGNGELIVTQDEARTLLKVRGSDDVVNYFAFNASISGTSPEIFAEGTDANIDFVLHPKGGGVLHISTPYTATGDVPITGYAVMKFADGVARKVAIID